MSIFQSLVFLRWISVDIYLLALDLYGHLGIIHRVGPAVGHSHRAQQRSHYLFIDEERVLGDMYDAADVKNLSGMGIDARLSLVTAFRLIVFNCPGVN
jgi:hypothetical protein